MNMTVTLPTWVKWLAGLVLAFFVITILRGFIPESSEAVSPDKPPYSTIFLSGFVFILLVFWPKAKAAKQGETPASQAGQWAWVILFGTSLGMILVWVAMALFTSDGSWGEFRDNGVRPRWAEENSVRLGDPMDLGHGVRPDLDSVRGFTCPSWTTVYKIPNGFIVDTEEDWYDRVSFKYLDKRRNETIQEGRGHKVAVLFQLCVKYPRDNGESVPLVWKRSPE